MLGASKYARAPLDFYPTPERAVQSLISVMKDDLPSLRVWEPFCGNGAISKIVTPHVIDCVSTDIVAYDGFDPDGLFDFFEIKTKAEADALFGAWDSEKTENQIPIYTMADIEALKGFMPDAIISNPPYGKEAERAARHAIALMEPNKGLVVFLCRHDWDTSKRRADLFDHPKFAMKIILRHRPRWIEGSKGAPRFAYAYFVWNWLKPISAKPEIIYAT